MHVDERQLTSPEDRGESCDNEVAALRAALPQDVRLHRVALEEVFQPGGDQQPQLDRQQLQERLQQLWTVSRSCLTCSGACTSSKAARSCAKTSDPLPVQHPVVATQCWTRVSTATQETWLCWLRHAPAGALRTCNGAAYHFSFQQCHNMPSHEPAQA